MKKFLTIALAFMMSFSVMNINGQTTEPETSKTDVIKVTRSENHDTLTEVKSKIEVEG